MSNIQTIAPGDSQYDEINKSLDKQGNTRIDYGELAEIYNTTPVKGLIFIRAPYRAKPSNIARVMQGRGLLRQADYTIFRMKEDVNGSPLPSDRRPIVIKKLSVANML